MPHAVFRPNMAVMVAPLISSNLIIIAEEFARAGAPGGLSGQGVFRRFLVLIGRCWARPSGCEKRPHGFRVGLNEVFWSLGFISLGVIWRHIRKGALGEIIRTFCKHLIC